MITDQIKTTLANHIEASLVVQGYHWNVEGINFSEYHSLFGEIYSDYYAQVDTLAEYIRILSSSKEYVNASIDILKVNKTLNTKPIVGDSISDYLNAIIDINDALYTDIIGIYDAAETAKEYGVSNYCADRLDAMNKLNWKLMSALKTRK